MCSSSTRCDEMINTKNDNDARDNGKKGKGRAKAEEDDDEGVTKSKKGR